MNWYKMAKKDLISKKKCWQKDQRASEESEIYNAGKLAAHQNRSRNDNPYPKEDSEHDIWNDGFDMGLVG